jgi:type I restriction enzyme S subunit
MEQTLNKYPTYKPSNIDWIGEIPSHWKVKKLKYFAQIMNGKDYQEFVLEEGGYPVFGTGGIFARCSKFLHDKPSVLLGRKGSVSNPQFVTEPFWTSDTTYYTDIKNDVEPMFLYHLVKQIQFDLYIYGSAIPSMTKSVYDDMLFPCPPLKEQQSIVSYLDEKTTLIDELIAKKQSKIALLKEQRTALINHAITKGLNTEVALKDSKIEWIGNIPLHWEVSKLRFLTKEVQTGSTPPTDIEEYFNGGTFDWFTPADFSTENIELNASKRKVSELAVNDGKVRVFPKNSVLMVGIGATLGKIGITNSDCSSNQQINSIIFNQRIKPYFGAYFLFSNSINIVSLANFATLPILNQSQTKDIPIVIPPLSEQQAIVAYLDEQTALIDKNIELESQKISTLKEYRQSLISNVVTGKIKVID